MAISLGILTQHFQTNPSSAIFMGDIYNFRIAAQPLSTLHGLCLRQLLPVPYVYRNLGSKDVVLKRIEEEVLKPLDPDVFLVSWQQDVGVLRRCEFLDLPFVAGWDDEIASLD